MRVVEAVLLIFAAILGALIGSFTNVLIYRIPRGESVAFPPSHCPNCDHRLGVLDLVPVVSWLFLRGKCRYCGNPITSRYPIVELISAIGYLAIAWRFPILDYGLATVGLWFFFTVLLAGSGIDLDTKTLPDVLTLPPVAVGLLIAFIVSSKPGLPDFSAALQGALIGAGLLALIAGLGAWVLRRFREPNHPDFPIDYMHVHLGALVGAWFGPVWAVVAVIVTVGANLIAKRLIRIPDFVTLGGVILSLVLSSLGYGQGLIGSVQGALMGAGAVALIAGVYWAIYFARHKQDDSLEEPDDADPVAMGFGDVKLAAVIGAFLGWQGIVMGLAAAVVLGAVIGVIQRIAGGDRAIPFGPYLALGALVALLTRAEPLLAYLRSVGL
jgi:leader peptidase (prepilin peptidase) / N-methyltransferase